MRLLRSGLRMPSMQFLVADRPSRMMTTISISICSSSDKICLFRGFAQIDRFLLFLVSGNGI